MRLLPDADLSLRDTCDFVFDSSLCRKALLKPNPPELGVMLRDIVTAIHKLTVSCHLPEFTDHGLSHLCSLVDRVSRWSTPSSGQTKNIVEGLSSTECAILLLAILFHDIGMLSQRPEDLPQSEPQWESRALRDVPNWVRATHIPRMESLVKRLFEGSPLAQLLTDETIIRALAVARAHGSWPWNWSGFAFKQRDAGLAAVLAVADLFDEDSNRCDTATLLHHRLGNHLNCAHWIRHSLTNGRVMVDAGTVNVELRRPPNSDAQLEPVYRALRNHFRLASLYVRELGQVSASLINISFSPQNGCPKAECLNLEGWSRLEGFGTQSALGFHLLNSFMPEALLDGHRIDPKVINRLQSLGFETIDLQNYRRVRGELELHSQDEQSFLALLE